MAHINTREIEGSVRQEVQELVYCSSITKVLEMLVFIDIWIYLSCAGYCRGVDGLFFLLYIYRERESICSIIQCRCRSVNLFNQVAIEFLLEQELMRSWLIIGWYAWDKLYS